MQPTREEVLAFKTHVDAALYALGEPPLSLAEAFIGFERAALALAVATRDKRHSRGEAKGFPAMPRPRLKVV